MIPTVQRDVGPNAQLKPDPQKQKLKEACQEFEAMLTGYVFKSMRQSVMRAEEPDQASQIYESMMDETLSREVSRHDNGGLADMLFRELAPLLNKDPAKGSP